MMHLAGLLFGSEEVFESFGLWAFLSIGAVALFAVFIPLVTYIDGRVRNARRTTRPRRSGG